LRLGRALAIVTASYVVRIVAGVIHPWMRLISLLTSGVGDIWSMGPLAVALFIFFHNTLAAIVIYAASMVYIGLLGIAFNGYVLAVAARYALHVRHFTVPQLLAALLPHGVVEVPALLLASAAGLLTFWDVRRKGLRAGGRGVRLLLLSILLLFIAAFIEAFVTPEVARALGAPVPGV